MLRTLIQLISVLALATLALTASPLRDQETEAALFTTNVPGDTDCNGSLNGTDAVYLLRHLAGADGVAGPCVRVGNLLCNDALDSADLRALLRALGGLDPLQPERCYNVGAGVISMPLSQGTATIHSTYTFDFDLGVEANNGSDVWWENSGSAAPNHDFALSPAGGMIALLPGADYDSLNVVALNLTAYSNEPIQGPPGAKNELPVGAVFAVLTDEGNYAKARVTASDYDLTIEWVTYQD